MDTLMDVWTRHAWVDLRNPRPVNLELAAKLYGGFLAALGLWDDDDPHITRTPIRVAQMYADVLRGGEPFQFTTFPADDAAADQMVFVGAIPFTSFCSHHFLPFGGLAHIAYIPRDCLVGLSKLPRLVQAHAARPQVQEVLTAQIAQTLQFHLNPLGVAVTLDARHTCYEIRGPKAVGATTRTTVLLDAFKEQPHTRAEYFAQVKAPD